MGEIVFPNLGIVIEKLDRTAFSLFGLNIYWYGIFIAFGAFLGVLLCTKEAKRTGQNENLYLDFACYGLVFGIIGARIYYLLFHEGSLVNFFKIREGGLAIYGGIIAGVIACVVYTKIKKVNLFKFTDTAAMSMLVGQIFGRWGNFFNREAFGSYTNSLFAMAYDVKTVGGAELKNGIIMYNNAEYPVTMLGNTAYIQVHPTFLYESVWNLCLLAIMFLYRKHKKFEGELSLMYFIGYGIGRFLIESLRTDQLMFFGMPVSMLLSGIFVIAAVTMEIVLRKRHSP
ncbi:MAG TPA: prolipoprotein diacylglyceryl transferase [Lachnospiraceae bacterium]|nr:prolipoprotein diacylglyceryl transferase [Lachnospiraceae bacterium]